MTTWSSVALTTRTPILVTFDGGARGVEGAEDGGDARVAGAGAVLWGLPAADGCRPALARTVVALPAVPFAQEAEAAGCGAALRLLLDHAPVGHRRAIVSGDNLAVVRYGAGAGRLKKEAMFARLDGSLGAFLCRGWSLAWRAVRRRLNKAADAALATSGVQRAAVLLREGRSGQEATVS